MKEQYKKLGKNTAWMIIGNFASKLLSFFLVPLYTYYLSTSDYGVADLMTTTISLLSPILTIAASEGILRFTLDDESDKGKIFTISIMISGFGLFILLLFSPVIIRYSKFEQYYFLFLLYYISNISSLLFQQFVKGLNKIKEYAISGFLHTLVGVGLNVLFLAILHKGVNGYLYAMIIGAASPAVYLFIKLKLWSFFRKPRLIEKEIVIKYIKYCLPLVVNQLSWWVNNSSDKYILTYYCGTSASGIYSVAYKLPSLIATITTIFYSAWQISAIDEFGSSQSIKFFSNVYKRYTSLLIISSSFLILIVKILAKYLFSKDFYYAWSYAVILIIAAIFQSLGSFVGTIYTSAMKPKAIFSTTLIGALINTILNFLLIPKFAAYGAAIATLIGYLSILFIRIIDSKKYLPMEVPIIRDVTNFSILFVQGLCCCLQVPYWKYISVVAFLCLIVINRCIITDILDLLIKRRKNT
jgi:O-antigen/teichoic acid export membrane protein